MRTPYPNELYHHGIKGQKWGVRRYQDKDGDWNDRGLARRRKREKKEDIKYYKELRTITKDVGDLAYANNKSLKKQQKRLEKAKGTPKYKRELIQYNKAVIAADVSNKAFLQVKKDAEKQAKLITEKYGKTKIREVPTDPGKAASESYRDVTLTMFSPTAWEGIAARSRQAKKAQYGEEYKFKSNKYSVRENMLK